jgi:hypothetical protein
MAGQSGEGGGGRFGGILRWVVAFFLWWVFWFALMLAGRVTHRVAYFVVAIAGTLVLLVLAGLRDRVRTWLRWYDYETMFLEPVRTFALCVFTLMLASQFTYRDTVVIELVGSIGVPVSVVLMARAWKRRKIWSAEQRFLRYLGTVEEDASSREEALDAFYWVVDLLEGDEKLAYPGQTVEEYLATIRVRLVRAGQDLHDAIATLANCGLVFGEEELLAMRLGDLVRRVAEAGCYKASERTEEIRGEHAG